MNYNQPFKRKSSTSSVQFASVVSSQRKFSHLVHFWQASDAWRAVIAFLMPFILYLYTLAPTIYNLDSAELTTATVSGGLMRATGYPLYLILGRLWVFLPIGDVGYRMNLFSAFNGALTALFVERILRRLGVGHWAALSSVGLLVTAPFFWSLSLVAEVYTLHTALMSLLILLLMDWNEHPSPKKLAIITLTIGLSMGHHLATALLVPGAVWYVFVTHPRQTLTPRAVFIALSGLVLGLSVYLYIPLRYLSSPVFNYAGTYDATGQFHPVNLATPDGLWWLFTAKSFAVQMFAYKGISLWNETVWFVGHLARTFFLIGLGPGFLGMAVFFRRNWKLSGMLFLMFACSAFFYIDYRVMDKETMLLPTYVVWAIWLGMGTQWLLDWVSASETPAIKVWAIRMLQGAIFISVLGAILYTGPKVDLSDDWSTRIRSEAILEYAEPNALIFGWWDTVPAIQYLQLVEGQRRDVQVVNRFLISFEDLTTYAKNEVSNRPVYINELPLGWHSIFDVKKAGPVFQLLPKDGESNVVHPQGK